MKEDIHPKYVECVVTCGCGNSFTTQSLKPTLAVEICSACHPFYTGKQRFVDTAGRVEKFTKKHAWDDSKKSQAAEKKRQRRAEIKFQTAAKVPPRKKGDAVPAEEDARLDRGRGGGRGRGGPRAGGPPSRGAPSAPAAEAAPAADSAPSKES